MRCSLTAKILIVGIVVASPFPVQAARHEWTLEMVDSMDLFSTFQHCRDHLDRVSIIGDRHGWSRVFPAGDGYASEHLVGNEPGTSIGQPITDGTGWFAVSRSPSGAFDLVEFTGDNYLIRDISEPGCIAGATDLCFTQSGNLVVCSQEIVSGELRAIILDPLDTDPVRITIDTDGVCGDSIRVIPTTDDGFQVFYRVEYPYFDLRTAICENALIHVTTLKSYGDTGQSIQAIRDDRGFAHLVFYDGWDLTYVYATDFPYGTFRFIPVFDDWTKPMNLKLVIDDHNVPHCISGGYRALMDRKWTGFEWTDEALYEVNTNSRFTICSTVFHDSSSWEFGMRLETQNSDYRTEYSMSIIRNTDGMIDETIIPCFDDLFGSWAYGNNFFSGTAVINTESGFSIIMVTQNGLILWERNENVWKGFRIPVENPWQTEQHIKAVSAGSSILVTQIGVQADVIEIVDHQIVSRDAFPGGNMLDLEIDTKGNLWVLLNQLSENVFSIGENINGIWQFELIQSMPLTNIYLADLEFDTQNNPNILVSNNYFSLLVSRQPPQWRIERVELENGDDPSDISEFEISNDDRFAVILSNSRVVMYEKTDRGWVRSEEPGVNDDDGSSRHCTELLQDVSNRWTSFNVVLPQFQSIRFPQIKTFDGFQFNRDTQFESLVGKQTTARFWHAVNAQVGYPVVTFPVDSRSFAIVCGKPAYPDLSLQMNDVRLESGDLFRLDLEIINGHAESTFHTAVLLEIPVGDVSLFYSWPDWIPVEQKTTFGTIDLLPDEVNRSTLVDFSWPDQIPPLNDCVFWGALFSEDFSALASDLARVHWNSF